MAEKSKTFRAASTSGMTVLELIAALVNAKNTARIWCDGNGAPYVLSEIEVSTDGQEVTIL